MALFGPPPALTAEDLLELLRRNLESHWLGGLLEDPSSRSLFEGMIAQILRIQEAADENFSNGLYILTAPGRAAAVAIVRISRPSGPAVVVLPANRFVDTRGAVWRPTAAVAIPASGIPQTIDIPITTERAGYWLNSFEPLTYLALDDLPDLAFVIEPSPDPATGGKTPFLDAHGNERSLPRAPNESDADYRHRMLLIPDAVSPFAMADAVIQVMDGSPATQPFSDLIVKFGLRALIEPFFDSAQSSVPGLAGGGIAAQEDAFLDDVTYLDDPYGHSIRDIDDTCAWFDVFLPHSGHPEFPAALAALADEMYRKRAACVGFRIFIGQDLVLQRHAADFDGQDVSNVLTTWSAGGLEAPADRIQATRKFGGDAAYVWTRTGAGAGPGFSVDDLVFELSTAPPPPVTFTHVVLRAWVRKVNVGAGVDPDFTFLIQPTFTVGARLLGYGTEFVTPPNTLPITVTWTDYREVLLILEQNPITAAPWTGFDISGPFQFGVANTAAVGPTEELRVADLSLEYHVNYG